ncbi:F-box protein [Phanerochaete sordida]|uniref:F-box protein n=1 Tax=Phanerochaete sordida TaxID=48140 RepID=A0A9P3FXN1_9APHY|nr:F-box protein [Phanerochaete sordida]
MSTLNLPDESEPLQLPPELVTIVLEHLDGENLKQDLFSCSLVSKDWYYATRPMLFPELTFAVRARSELHSELAQRNGHGPLDDLLQFFEQSPHISRYVEKLRIDAPVDDLSPPDITTYPDVHPTTLGRILRLLPRLTVLEFHDVVFHPEFYEAWKQDERTFDGDLSRVTVSFGTRAADIDSLDEALHLLELFAGNIQELCLSTIYAVQTRKPTVLQLQRLRVAALIIDEVTDIGPIVRAVQLSPSVWSKTLQSIYLSWINMKDLFGAEGLLEDVKPYLKHFGCNLFPLLDSKPADQALFRILDFSDYDSLETLTLGLVLMQNASWNENIWRDVCRLLRSLPASRAAVLDVTFELCTDRLDYGKHIALDSSWSALDATLAGRCRSVRLFPSRKSYYTPATHPFNANMRKYIAEALPGLATAKVLRFE